MTNYWIKDITRQEIITKTMIPNSNNINFFASYFNLIDCKGLSFHFNGCLNLITNKLFVKNGFEYFINEHENFSEFLILPNEKLEKLTHEVVLKMNFCKDENEFIDLVLREMSLNI